MKPEVMEEVFAVIKDRRDNPRPDSYVATLLYGNQEEIDMDRVVGKIDEEAEELVQAVKEESTSEIVKEATDLIFHVMIVLAAENIELNEVFREFRARRK